MKKIQLLLAVIFSVLVYSCSEHANHQSVEKVYGAKIDTSHSICLSEIPQYLDANPGKELIIKGRVAEVCKSEGCWLSLINSSGENVIVRTLKHNYTVPMDIEGREVYVRGEAFTDTTIVEVLKHYAEEAGQSEKEIEAIRQPSINYVVEARGIVLLNKEEGN